jgi:hypothetical protein
VESDESNRLESEGYEGMSQGLKRVLKTWLYQPKRTSGAEAHCKQSISGTAEGVPLGKTDFFSTL